MNFKSVFLFKKTSSRGFTLIELLVTIGILGILAASLIATIDPFEQLRKADDANTKNTAVEFNDSMLRYYTTHSALPWAVDTSASCGGGNPPTSKSLTDSSLTGCLTDLVNDGELKAAFTTATSVLQNITVTGNATSVTACFLPQSKSQQRDLNTKYTVNGQITTGCASQTSGGSTSCYWCSL